MWCGVRRGETTSLVQVRLPEGVMHLCPEITLTPALAKYVYAGLVDWYEYF